MNGVAKTLKGVAGKLEKADAPDPGVLDALDELGKVFESGVEKLQFIVPGIQGQRRRVVADFDPKILPKIRARKQDFRLNGLQSSDRSSETAESSAGDPSSEGSVLEGMLDALDGKVRISPAVGRATTLSFGPDKAKEVYEALHKPVKVRIDPGTHKVKDIQITLPYLSDESGFFARQTIEQLIDQQHVRPMTNLEDLAGAIPDEDVEQMIAEVYRERESPI